MLDEPETQTQSFRLEEATIDDLHRAIRSGATTVVEVVQHYLARVRAYNGVASMLVTQDGAPVPEATGVVRAGAALQVPDPDGEGLDDPARSRQVPGAAARVRPHGGDRLRCPTVQQQFGMIVGIPECRPAQRARHAEHPRRTLGHVQGRVRQASLARAAAARRAAGLRVLPPAARRAGARRRAGQACTGAIPISKRCRCTASCSRSRIRSTPRTCARPAAATRAYDIDFPARDHVLVEQLRNKGAIIFAKAVNTEYNGRAGDPGGRQQARQGAAVDARLSAQHLGGQSVESVRHHALRLARLELRLGRLGQRQPGDGQSRRGDAGVVPRSVQPQRGCADPAAQGDARLRRRRDRRRHLLRPLAASTRARSPIARKSSMR